MDIAFIERLRPFWNLLKEKVAEGFAPLDLLKELEERFPQLLKKGDGVRRLRAEECEIGDYIREEDAPPDWGRSKGRTYGAPEWLRPAGTHEEDPWLFVPELPSPDGPEPGRIFRRMS